MISRNMYDEAFAAILRRTQGAKTENEDMLLIRAISKLGSFSVEKISDPVRCELFKRSISLIESGEFIDIFLGCFIEASNRPEHVSPNLCFYVASNFARIREEDIERSMKFDCTEKYTMEQRANMETIVLLYQKINSGRPN